MRRGQEYEAGGHSGLLQQWMCWGHPRGCGGGGTPALCSWTPRGLPWDSHFGGHPGGCRGVSPQSCHGARDHPAGGVTLGLPWGWGHSGGVTLRTLGGSTWAVPLGSHLPSLQGRAAGSPWASWEGHPGENPPVSGGHCGGPLGSWGSSWGSWRCPHRKVLQQVLEARGRGAAVAAELAPHRLLCLSQQLLGLPHLGEELRGRG